jgi:tRNA-specific 2-thiouridylase
MPEITDIPHNSTIAVGMSGGVDSTMTAQMLVERGFQVVGLTMKTWNGAVELPNVGRSGCFGPGEIEDIASAKAASERIGIRHYVIDLSDYYQHAVLDYLRSEYLAGRTPNPCARCNQIVKCGDLLDQARKNGVDFDYFATGHYARARFDPETRRHVLLRGVDSGKDQSYFLARLKQDQLARLVLPLGGMTKDEVKETARRIGWSALAEKRESQDFIETGDYSSLFQEQDSRLGPIVDGQGNVLGEHKGIIHYTIGQRRGLGIGGAKNPLYVVQIDAEANTLHVGMQDALLAAGLKADELNWIAADSPPKTPRRIEAKIRFRHKAASAILAADLENGAERVAVTFERPQSAVTPGQLAVFYEGDVVLGSGTILST